MTASVVGDRAKRGPTQRRRVAVEWLVGRGGAHARVHRSAATLRSCAIHCPSLSGVKKSARPGRSTSNFVLAGTAPARHRAAAESAINPVHAQSPRHKLRHCGAAM